MVIFYFKISYIIGTKVVNNVFGTTAYSWCDNHPISTSSWGVRGQELRLKFQRGNFTYIHLD